MPGLSQQALPEKKSANAEAGHACGHHLFGTASVSAGIAIKELIAAGKLKGTIKVFGTPAEEGGSGKVFLVRAGLFNNLDAVIHWHPDDVNAITTTSALANKSAKFKFYGVASHAAMSPDQWQLRMAVLYSLERKKILVSQYQILDQVKRVLLLSQNQYSHSSCLEKTEKEEQSEEGESEWFQRRLVNAWYFKEIHELKLAEN